VDSLVFCALTVAKWDLQGYCNCWEEVLFIHLQLDESL
jgi:hypothetical protein